MDQRNRDFTELEALGEAARIVTMDVADEVIEMLERGKKEPLSSEEAAKVVEKTIVTIREKARESGDSPTVAALEDDIQNIVERVLQDNDVSRLSNEINRGRLVTHNGIIPRPVFPTPFMHGIEVPMREGYIRTRDIALWPENVRLDIHIAQFKSKNNNRNPGTEDLRRIMEGKAGLAGIYEDDEFQIEKLAASIALSGVKVPPILSKDDTLLDGNRRITAALRILDDDGSRFTAAQKARVEYVFVRQLAETTDQRHEDAVVIANNFEDDTREPWDHYIRARKIYDAFIDRLQREPKPLSSKRKVAIRQSLASDFGVTDQVASRYIQMVELALDFEDYHINTRKQNIHEVMHQSKLQFQYFDELRNGTAPGGVYHTVNNDDYFKSLVYDLLYEDKFNSWRDIRVLKLVPSNDEAMELLKKARQEPSKTDGQERVKEAMVIAQAKDPKIKSLGANTRIEVFIKWLKEIPIADFDEESKFTTSSLLLLYDGFEIVERQIAPILKKRGVL